MKCIPKWRFNFGLIYFACLNVQLRVKPIKSSDNLFARARKSDDNDGRWWFHSRAHHFNQRKQCHRETYIATQCHH